MNVRNLINTLKEACELGYALNGVYIGNRINPVLALECFFGQPHLTSNEDDYLELNPDADEPKRMSICELLWVLQDESNRELYKKTINGESTFLDSPILDEENRELISCTRDRLNNLSLAFA